MGSNPFDEDVFGPGSGAHYNLDVLTGEFGSPLPKEEAPEVTALRSELTLDRCRLRPFTHQVVGINSLVNQEVFALFDEMGAGKTFQTIVAQCILFLRGEIDRVIVVAPAPVRSVWFHPELGELAKHLWFDFPASVTEFHSRTRTWYWKDGYQKTPDGVPLKRLEWIITNYELIRSKRWLTKLLPFATKRTTLVCDESSALKTWTTNSTKAVRELRKRVGRIVLLNGTPVADKPFDMFSQGNLMDPRILETPFMTNFKARYAVMGGFEVAVKWSKKKVPTEVVAWTNLEDLQRRFAPYVLRRLKTQCLDLPPKLPPVVIPVTLRESWKPYVEMRKEMVAWLSETTVSTAQQAITKVMRLAQITSGFVGGVEEFIDTLDEADRPDWMPLAEAARPQPELPWMPTDSAQQASGKVREVGREKLDTLLAWVALRLEEDPNLKLLVWSRFRPEVARAVAEFRAKFPAMDVGEIRGGQKRSLKNDERATAMKLMDPRFAPKGPATVFLTSAGAMGLTLTASHTVVRLSRSYRLLEWLQGDDRVHRPGQTNPISYFDLVAVGPRGQRTVDHDILAGLQAKRNVADYTTSAWVNLLRSDGDDSLELPEPEELTED